MNLSGQTTLSFGRPRPEKIGRLGVRSINMCILAFLYSSCIANFKCTQSFNSRCGNR